MKKHLRMSAHFLEQYIHVQLFISVISLPILIWWGLPFSLMSLVGNLLFSPIIITFLSLSCLIFITELVFLPNYYFIWLLEKTTTIMTTLLGYGSKKWLYAFPSAPSFVLALFSLITIALLLSPRIRKSSLRTMGTLSCIMITLFIYGYGVKAYTQQHTMAIPLTNEKLSATFHKNGTVSLHDQGAFNRKNNPENYVNFELKPYLHQTYGTITISELALDKMSMRSIRAALALCSTISINHVTLKKEDRAINKSTWRLYYKLKDALENNVTIA